MEAFLLRSLKKAKRLIVAIVGFTVLLIGIALMVLPGPAFVVIPIGIGILATEFAWARRLLVRVKEAIRRNEQRKAPNSGGPGHDDGTS
ncbi:MAG TPA: PGPGW domain-containing protein [Dissulfurispiraceae bacterium]|nr:PGPGW domain-containing protein [Dissulfurispiraceae bacterium]